MWKQPLPIDWTQIPDLSEVQCPDITLECQDAKYRAIMHQLEVSVDAALATCGKPQLLSRQKGRAATHEVHWVSEYTKPPTKGRDGEFQPSFHGIDPQHARWLRQIRRLHNLLKLRTRTELNPMQLDHAACLWKSICTSKGFPPNFPAWWNNSFGHMATLTTDQPSLLTLRTVVDTVEASFNAMEKALIRTRVATAKQRRLDNPNVIFKDLKKEPPKPCQSLLHSCKAVVTEVNETDMSVTVDPPQPWDPEIEVRTTSGMYTPIHAEPDQLWLHTTDDVQVGQSMIQDQYIGQLSAMFDAFGKEWSSRWDRHLHVQSDFWDPVVDFVRTAFPKQPVMQYEPISYETWRAALKRKSKRAAVGPDGAARMDLLRMPKSLTVQLLQILSDVEAGKPWPSQLLQGFIIALEKVEGFAEGCALSVTSMICINIVAHKWLSLKFERTTLYSYVDNLELLCPSANEALSSLDELVHFTEVLDVAIDFGKTYVWSTQGSGRRHLREQQVGTDFQIQHWARDLGGHMTYTRQHTNRTVVKRLENMPPLWNLLARSLAPYPQKLRSLRSKAWPLALHGSPSVMLAENHFTTLRTGAMRGLREHASGVNPMLHLSAVEHPMHDPQFHVLVSSVMTLRAHGPSEDVLDFIFNSISSVGLG
eukprot:s70_g32.t1